MDSPVKDTTRAIRRENRRRKAQRPAFTKDVSTRLTYKRPAPGSLLRDLTKED